MHKLYLKYLTFVLIIIAILFLNVNKKSSIANENIFNIKNTSEITKIFLADRNGQTITLNKKNNKWTVNNKFNVRKDAIKTLLLTAENIRIKKPVPKTALENVAKFIATSGVYIEFYSSDKIIKSYFIGSNTPDHLGTYMLLNGNKKPFVVHIPTFNGFLSPRYGIQGNALNLSNWRSNLVFNISSENIKHIKYTNYINQEESYYLDLTKIKLFNYENQIVSFNKEKVLKLINSFKNLNCEVFKKDKSKLNTALQLEELIINSDTLRTYQISNSKKINKKDNFTVNRKFATLNNGDLMLIQDYVFNKVLINITELIN